MTSFFRFPCCLFALLLVVSLASAHSEKQDGNAQIIDLSEGPHFSKSDHNSLKMLWAGLADATDLKVYEGLPHPFWDKTLYDAEKRRSHTITLNGQLFYADGRTPTAEACNEICRSLRVVDFYRPTLPVPKQCGGFHADYAITWNSGERDFRLLVCFGCGEIHAYGPGFTIETDLSKEGYVRLRKLLIVYWNKRPKGEVAF